MVSPAIALRFRDTTPDIDTIAEHRSLISRNGKVGWGWWKKDFEPLQTKEIADRLASEPEIGVVLIDRTAKRAYLCACNGYAEPSAADTDCVPSYYRSHLNTTAGVFIFRSIEDIEYQIEIAGNIGDQTFLWIGSEPDQKLSHVASPSKAIGRSYILHLSDLHFGKDYGFRLQSEEVDVGTGRKTLSECLIADLDRLNATKDVAAMIVTGDFMTHGAWDDASRRAALAEFEVLRGKLQLEREQIVAVPGNHDVVRYPDPENIDVRENAVAMQTNMQHETMYRTFVEQLIGRHWEQSLNYVRRINLGDVDVDICVLNSCTINATQWTEYGYVGTSGLDTIAELESQTVERPTIRFLALHHHLLPVANVEIPKSRGVSLTLDASDLLAAAQRAGVHIAIHGHQHKPKIAVYQNLPLNGETSGGAIHVVANGSAGAKHDRLPSGERNTYCLFQLQPNATKLWIRELRLDAVAGAQVFCDTLKLSPIQIKC